MGSLYPFSKNRDRLLEHAIIPALFEEVVELARKQDLLSEDHFSVDGTLIHAWTPQKKSSLASCAVS
jgi:transposase